MPFPAPHLRPSRGWFVLLALGLIARGEAAEPARGEPAEPQSAQTTQASPALGTMPEDYIPGLQPILVAALKESPTMLESALQVEVADANRRSSGVAPLLPSLGGSGQYGDDIESVSSNSSATSRTKGLQYAIGASQALFQWGALKNSLEIEKALELISKKQYAEGYRALASSVRRQYLGLIVDKLGVRNGQFALRLSQDALGLAQTRLKAGTLAQGDMVSPQMDADERQLRSDRLEQAYEVDRRSLARLVGWKDIPDESIPGEIPVPKYSPSAADELLAGLLRDGARNTFQAQIDELYVRENDLAYKIASVRLLPKFSATAGYAIQNQAQVSSGQVSQTTLANETYYLVGSWTLFDGFATRAAKQAAAANRRYYEKQLQVVTDSAMDTAQNSRRSVDFAWRAMNLADRRFQIADSLHQRSLDELKLGNISQDTVNGAQDSVNQTDYDNASARADFLSAWSDFVSIVGADPALGKLPAHYVHDTR